MYAETRFRSKIVNSKYHTFLNLRQKVSVSQDQKQDSLQCMDFRLHVYTVTYTVLYHF